MGYLLAVVIYGLGKGLFEFTQFSHSRVFQNQTLEEVGNRASVDRPLVDEKQSFDIAVSIWALPLEENTGESSSVIPETTLYSDIVFRGLCLADKHRTANLTYKLPIAIFLIHNQRLLLKENNLRASFVLIPTSPSLVNQITNFSTWRPKVLTIPPVRSWPFPLGAADNGPQSAADRALDLFGILMPLLEFHEFGSKCTNSTNSDTSSSKDKPVDNKNNENNEAKYPEHALKRHPFVVTRTQIRAVDETRIFNRKLYNKEHNKLRSTSDEDTGESLTEWVYAPYLSHAKFGVGPQLAFEFDRIAYPSADFINVDWRISYLGRSPAKYLLSDSLAESPKHVAYNKSDYKKVMPHDKAELLNAHPCCRLLINNLSAILKPILNLLNMEYWFTRMSTVSIRYWMHSQARKLRWKRAN
ncbi:hypothetical protein B0H14DRAFT_3675132 [Mycena olivaceomarginata]|nr:hypothetical protein B0H14DRAFT_3675132 [Mycena olivaceomarginata]